MAGYGDYFDLLARAVARCGAETAGARQQIYEGARHAQALQLQTFDQRRAASAIQRELNALDEAIRRIEIAASEEPTIVEVWQTLLEPETEEVAESPKADRSPRGLSLSRSRSRTTKKPREAGQPTQG